MIKQIFSSRIILFLLITFTSFQAFKNKRWESLSIVREDVKSYYSYLPAAFIYHDLTFKFVDSLPKEITDKVSAPLRVDYPIIQKMTSGVALLLLPFFLGAHVYSIINNLPLTGYTSVYEFSIAIAALFYFSIGLFFLRKCLKKFFNDDVVALTLAVVTIATNLFYYTTYDCGMSHVYSFCLFSLFLWLTIKWHEKVSPLNTIALGLIFGLITLVRPTDCVVFIFFILYNVTNKNSFLQKISLLKTKWNFIFLMIISILLPISIQLMYWKFASGNFIYYSYNGEHFFFNKPHIWDGLFSFRKGFFIYSPVMFFLFPGIWFALRQERSFSLATTVFFIINAYVIFSWWSWWYGGSFGSRPLINSFAILSLPLAVFISKGFDKGILVKGVIIVFAILFIILNLFQTWQAQTSLLHWDSMNAKTYFAIFGKTQYPDDYDLMLTPTDGENANKGLPERDMFSASISKLTLLYSYKGAIKADNGKYASVEANNNGIIICNRDNHYLWETFLMKRYKGNVCTLQSYEGRFVGVDLNDNLILRANKTACEWTEIFRIKDLGNNCFALKSFDGRYVFLEDKGRMILKNGSKEPHKKESFLFVSE